MGTCCASWTVGSVSWPHIKSLFLGLSLVLIGGYSCFIIHLSSSRWYSIGLHWWPSCLLKKVITNQKHHFPSSSASGSGLSVLAQRRMLSRRLKSLTNVDVCGLLSNTRHHQNEASRKKTSSPAGVEERFSLTD